MECQWLAYSETALVDVFRTRQRRKYPEWKRQRNITDDRGGQPSAEDLSGA